MARFTRIIEEDARWLAEESGLPLHRLRGRTILLTSHYLEEVERLCRDIAIVARGRVVREGTKDEMIRGPGGLEAAYLTATGAEADHVAGQ